MNTFRICQSCGMAFEPMSQAINTCNHCLAVIRSDKPEEEAELQACGEFAKRCDDDDLLRKELPAAQRGMNLNLTDEESREWVMGDHLKDLPKSFRLRHGWVVVHTHPAPKDEEPPTPPSTPPRPALPPIDSWKYPVVALLWVVVCLGIKELLS